MKEGGAVLSNNGAALRTRMGGCADRIGSSILLRHRCYMDSRPKIIAAKTVMLDEAGMRLIPADVVFPAASALSSLRAHPDRLARSAGHTTRLKFALCNVSLMLVYGDNMRTWEMQRL
jgi:hypothetical protein